MDIRLKKQSNAVTVLFGLLAPACLTAAVILGYLSASLFTDISSQNQNTYRHYTMEVQNAFLMTQDGLALETSGSAVLDTPVFEIYENDLWYYATDPGSGRVITNMEQSDQRIVQSMIDEKLAAGGPDQTDGDVFSEAYRDYSALLPLFLNGKASFIQVSLPTTEYSEVIAYPIDTYSVSALQHIDSHSYSGTVPVVVALKQDLPEDSILAYERSEAYSQTRLLFLGAASGTAAGAGLFILFLVLFLKRRESRRAILKGIARVMGKIPLEVKLLLCALWIFFFLIAAATSIFYYPIITLCLFGVGIVFGFLLLLDLAGNRLDFFRNNLFRRMRRSIERWTVQYPFQQQLMLRIKIYAGFLLGLTLFAAFLELVLLSSYSNAPAMIVGLFYLAAVLSLGISFYRQLRQTVYSAGVLAEYVEQIRRGEAGKSPELLPGDPLMPIGYGLSQIREGISQEVEQRVKAEKMKVELITNVSHDLKTPLTSIINYTELLSKESLQPEEANDYVRVLKERAHRLKNMTDDLFEMAKVNSGNITLELETLDLGELLEQALAESGSHSSLEFKLQLPEEPVMITGDGKRVWRILDNLLGNAVKYSLAGTRVYLTVTREPPFARLEVKNIAGYEMNFTGEEIKARFARGDKARTTEGSGLGLSIAESFCRLQGGDLQILVDGDLFKVIVRLPLAETDQAPGEERQ